MQTIELTVTGMNCGACLNHVTQALESSAGVQEAVVDLQKGRATVRGENLEASALIEAVEEEGYGARLAPQATP